MVGCLGFLKHEQYGASQSALSEVGIASVKVLGTYYADYGKFFEICHENSKVLPPMPLSTKE